MSSFQLVQAKITRLESELGKSRVNWANKARLVAKLLKLLQLQAILEEMLETTTDTDIMDVFKNIHNYEPHRAKATITTEAFDAFKQTPDFLWHGWECIGEMENVWGVEVLTTEQMTKWSKENPDGYWLYPAGLEDVEWFYEYVHSKTGEVQFSPVRYKTLSSFAREWNSKNLKQIYARMAAKLAEIDQWELYTQINPEMVKTAEKLGLVMGKDDSGYFISGCIYHHERITRVPVSDGWYQFDSTIRDVVFKAAKEKKEHEEKVKAFKTPILRNPQKPMQLSLL